MRYVCFAVLVVGLTASSSYAQVRSAKSPTCNEVAGQSQKDVANALKFCDALIPKDLDVQGVIAYDTLLWLKVSRRLTNHLMADRLTTEQVIKTWMKGWKALCGKQAVTVTVEWGDVEIAKGDTTILRGDVVTIKQ
jgi:hypothetical protein